MERDILIVSDTHGRATRLKELIEYRKKLLSHGEVLNLIFLGDGLNDLFSCEEYNNIITHIVRGNCDTGVRFTPFGEEIPFYRVITVGNYKAFLTHGNLFNVKYDREELCRVASEMDADIVLLGHTHAPTLEYIKKGSVRGVNKDLVLFNPGSLGDFDGTFGNLSLSDNGFLLSHGKYHNIVNK